MSHRKFGLKAFGVCLLAALGMTAFMAAGAQASWLVGNPATTLSGERALKGKAHTEGILSVPSKLLEILCTTLAAGAGSKINSSSLAFALGILNFTGCQTISNHAVVTGCKPAEPVVGRGQGNLFLHNGKEYFLLTPDDPINNRFARIDFPGATCALPDTNITGSIVLECLTQSLTTGNCLSHEASHLVQEAPAALFGAGHGLLYGGNASTISGIANVELESGEAWSGHV